MAQRPRSVAANPFRPGFGDPPVVLAGRDDLLERGDEAVLVAAEGRRTPRPLLFVGVRGMGKTVLLSEMASRAGLSHGWPRLRVEAGGSLGLGTDLRVRAGEIEASLSMAQVRRRVRLDRAVVKAAVAGIGAEAHFAREEDSVPERAVSLRRALKDLIESLQMTGGGLVLTIDELHAASRAEFADVAALLQEATEEHWPLVVLAAGLPSMGKSGAIATYFERGEWHEVGPLKDSDTAVAFAGPAKRARRPFDGDALHLLVERAGGYPFAIQLYGDHAWHASQGHRSISLDAAQIALRTGDAELTGRLYASRWDEASLREREYLVAVADLLREEIPVTSKTVAGRLAKTSAQVAPYRDRLIKKGILVAGGRTLRFVVPGMAEFVRRRGGEGRPAR